MPFKLFFLIFPLFILISCASDPNHQTEAEKKADIFYEHGTESLVGKNYSEALDALQKADQLTPNQTKILNNLAMAYYFKGAHKEATQMLKKSLEVDPKNSDARNNLASLYYEQGSMRDAEIEYQNVLKDLVYPKQFRTYYNLGLIKLRQGKLVEARQFFEMSIKDNNNYCPAHFELGRQEFIFGNYRNAVKKFNDATLGNCYNEPASHYYLGLSFLELKEYKKARDKFEEVVSKFTEDELAKKSTAQLKKMQSFLPPAEADKMELPKSILDAVSSQKAAVKKNEAEIGESAEF